MFKTCRILNRQTGDIFKGQIDTVFQGLPEYELVEIPDDGKIYESIENLPYYQEKLPNIEEQKQTTKKPFSKAGRTSGTLLQETQKNPSKTLSALTFNSSQCLRNHLKNSRISLL